MMKNSWKNILFDNIGNLYRKFLKVFAKYQPRNLDTLLLAIFFPIFHVELKNYSTKRIYKGEDKFNIFWDMTFRKIAFSWRSSSVGSRKQFLLIFKLEFFLHTHFPLKNVQLKSIKSREFITKCCNILKELQYFCFILCLRNDNFGTQAVYGD